MDEDEDEDEGVGEIVLQLLVGLELAFDCEIVMTHYGGESDNTGTFQEGQEC